MNDTTKLKNMGIIREPEHIDFEVNPRQISEQERSEISAIIAHYKKTGEVKKLKTKRKKKGETAK